VSAVWQGDANGPHPGGQELEPEFPFTRAEAPRAAELNDWLAGDGYITRTVQAPPQPPDKDLGEFSLGRRAVPGTVNPPRGLTVRRSASGGAQLMPPRQHEREIEAHVAQLGREYFDPPQAAKPKRRADPHAAPHALGELSEALGVSEPALRRWEKAGYLPASDHRTAGRAVAGGFGGKSTSSTRRYTDAQYNGLVRIAIQEQVANRSVTGKPQQPISETEFGTRARQLFERLAAEAEIPGETQ
jgi:hypothetical protein